MTTFATARLPTTPTATAPDGSEVRVLLRLTGGSMAHFRLLAGQVAQAVTHRSVDELWYVLEGRGEMWRKQENREDFVVLEPGTCLSLPLGTHFQFRAAACGPLSAVAVTLPPWPGDQEAIVVAGPWTPSLSPSEDT